MSAGFVLGRFQALKRALKRYGQHGDSLLDSRSACGSLSPPVKWRKRYAPVDIQTRNGRRHGLLPFFRQTEHDNAALALAFQRLRRGRSLGYAAVWGLTLYPGVQTSRAVLLIIHSACEDTATSHTRQWTHKTRKCRRLCLRHSFVTSTQHGNAALTLAFQRLRRCSLALAGYGSA